MCMFLSECFSKGFLNERVNKSKLFKKNEEKNGNMFAIEGEKK